jgi:hypothetical protein
MLIHIGVARGDCSEWNLVYQDCISQQFRKWPAGTTVWYEIKQNPPFPSSAFESVIYNAASQWDGAADNLNIVPGVGQVYVPVTAEYTTWADDDSAAASTLVQWGGYPIAMSHAEIHFNFVTYEDATAWDTSGQAENKICLTHVALHEWGHVIGLAHVETQCSGTIMDPALRKKELENVLALGTKDVAAAAILYGQQVYSRYGPSSSNCSHETTWGKIKSRYRESRNYSNAMALSGEWNTLAWNHLPNAAERRYFVYRSENDSDEVQLLGTTLGDSVFVDTQTVFGERYTYHIACAEDSTLLEVGTPVAGLKLIRDHALENQSNQLTVDLAVRGSVVYAALAAAEPGGPGVGRVAARGMGCAQRALRRGRTR